jgi:hypothetical protein
MNWLLFSVAVTLRCILLQSPTLSPDSYEQYLIGAVTQETQDTWRFTCQLGLNQTLGLQPGQHIVIR